jgi:F-type H+-transporting ATPase subunit a
MIICSPFEQFVVNLHKVAENHILPLEGKIYITETLIVCVWIILLYCALYLILALKKQDNTQSALLTLMKLLYEFVSEIVSMYLPVKGRIYFPLFFYLFLFITTSNLIGILPYAFTITSHLSITFSLAFMIWFGVVVIGVRENGLRFLSLFFPRGVPFILVPFLVLIETVSYVFRPVSLALRLFANIVAGHILLETLALFIYKMVYPAHITFLSVLVAAVPFIVCMVLIVFEFAVALLQGYIFIVLACIYLKDSYSAQKH